MYSPFTFNSNVHRATSNYQQQSGQPIYNIGAPSFTAGFMNHTTNPLVNHRPTFIRSFASVVSCESDLGKRHLMGNINKGNIHNIHNNNNHQSGSISSFFAHFNQSATPHPPPTHNNKEFEDYKHMPSHNFSPQQHYNHQQPPTSHINTKVPMNSSFNPVPPSANHSNIESMSTATRNFMASFFGGYQQPPQQPPPKPRNQRWFQKGFRCRGKGRNHNNNANKFHDHDVNLPKNAQEKERTSVERDIKEDISCDFVNVENVKEVVPTSNQPTNQPTETASGSCHASTDDDPPFMIYSLEEFPAIDCKPEKKSPTASPPAKTPETVEEGFVLLPISAALSTPSLAPKRTSICEKIMKSPQKLFPKPIPANVKSCLKAPRRSISECSDDFIVFANDSNEHEPEDIFTDSESESETDSDEDDDDDIVFEAHEMKEIAEGDEMSDEDNEDEDDDEVDAPEQRLDSGVGEKRVSDAKCTAESFLFTNFEFSILGSFRLDPEGSRDASVGLRVPAVSQGRLLAAVRARPSSLQEAHLESAEDPVADPGRQASRENFPRAIPGSELNFFPFNFFFIFRGNSLCSKFHHESF